VRPAAEEEIDRSVLAWIDDHTDVLVDLTRELVSLPTPNPPGDGCDQWASTVQQWFTRAGLPASLVSTTPNGPGMRPGVMSTLGRKGTGETLCFQGHYDTVGPASGWAGSPWDPVLSDGRIYGLGTTDMKGGIAAMMVAAAALADVGPPTCGELSLLFTPDEEFPAGPGIHTLIDSGQANFDYVIVGEPSGLSEIHLGMKDAIFGDIRVYGVSTHGSTPKRGVNAFEKYLDLASRLRSDVCPVLARQTIDLEVTPKDHPTSSLMLGGLVSGSNMARSAVPDRFNASFDLRILPGFSKASPLEMLKTVIADLKAKDLDFKADLHVSSRTPGYLLPMDSRLALTLQKAVGSVTGQIPRFTVSSGGMETSFFVERGIPALAFGPGCWECAHAAGEYVVVENLVAAAKTYALAARWLLSEE
jgi:succinyl-diaminopimelate desuccinylase